ncbi:MAG: aldehyde dehydrogenase family protein [Fimbriiglobus sp.]
MIQPFADESARCRAAHLAWAAQPVRDRLRFARELRHRLVEHADALTAAVEADVMRSPGEVVGTDLLPSAAALKFLHSRGERILRPRRVGHRPLWLMGCRDTVYRRPHGVVGVIGTWNYPVFLNVVPIAHALAAGNGVLWKPSELAAKSGEVLHRLFLDAGVPADLFRRLPATREAGPQLADAAIDFLQFTGSDRVGRALAARLGERLIPSVLELSGVDAVFVLADADVRLAARSAWYGATLNSGQTCMACRRVFVHSDVYERFVTELRPLVEATSPPKLVTPGQAAHAAELRTDATAAGCEVVGNGPTAVLGATPELRLFREASFAPLLGVARFATEADVLRTDAGCPFGLAAAVFTADPAAADRIARQLRVGAVVVNDVIVPTAHPATPFGGRGQSGWGSTQGEDGLLAMTVPQVVTHRSGTFRPHVDAALSGDPAIADVFRGSLRFDHGRGIGERVRGLRQLVGGVLRTKRSSG